MTIVSADVTPVKYTPGSVTNTLQQRLTIFYPTTTTKPPGGWPVMLHSTGGGSNDTLPQNTLNDEANLDFDPLLIEVLNAGIAVVTMGQDGGRTRVEAPWAVWYDVGTPTYIDLEEEFAAKDAEFALQWCVNQGAASYDLSPDLSRYILFGGSGGGMALSWVALGPDRARLAGGAQVQTSTRQVGGFIWQRPVQVWNPAYEQSSVLGYPWPDSTTGQPATSIANVAEAVQKASSVYSYAGHADNDDLPVLITNHHPYESVDFGVTDSEPDVADLLTNNHPGWGSEMLVRLLKGISPAAEDFFNENSQYIVLDETAVPGGSHTSTFSDGAQAEVGHSATIFEAAKSFTLGIVGSKGAFGRRRSFVVRPDLELMRLVLGDDDLHTGLGLL